MRFTPMMIQWSESPLVRRVFVRSVSFSIRRQARQTDRPHRVHKSYGLVVLFQLLPTPPHDDAVTFRYRPENVYLKRTYTSLTKHTDERTILSRCDPADRPGHP